MTIRFLSSGDNALVVEFGDQIDPAVSAAVTRLAAAIAAARIPGITELVPTFRSLMVCYDPLFTDARTLSTTIQALSVDDAAAAGPARLWTFPTSYAPEHAPDLADVAAKAGLSADEVVRRHSAGTYHVYMLGFLPGYAYMGDLEPTLVLPRRTSPRTNVPAGSVAIAMKMTCVYPVESPGGWNLIGNTPVRLFDLGVEPPSLLAPGDKVRFAPIDADAFRALAVRVAEGNYRPTPEVLR